MKRMSLLGTVLAAALTVAAMSATVSLAAELPEILPTSTTTRTFTGESEGALTFTSETAEAGVNLVVECEKATSEGTEEAGKPSGLFHFHIVGCHSTIGGVTVKCTDLNHSTPGEILELGTWDLVFERENGKEFKELTTGVLSLIELVHFGCSSLVLAELKGQELCLDLKATEQSKAHSAHCVANGPKQTQEWCGKDITGVCSEPVAPKLESNTNHTAFRSSAEQSLGNTITPVALFADI